MDHPCRTISRRDLLIASGTCALASSTARSGLAAQENVATSKPEVELQAWQKAVNSVVGDAKIIDGRIGMDVPEIAENGNVVPLNILIASAMTSSEFVRTVRIFSTANLHPLIATFRFSAESGKAAVSSRIRLAKTQDVVVLAELSDGTFLRGAKNVKVTIGGCGG